MGQIIGQLTVVGEQKDESGVRWICQCACGRRCSLDSMQLGEELKTHCGCQTRRGGRIADLRGRRIHRLLPLEPLEKRDAKGSVIWRCRCDCGKEIEASYNTLMYSNLKSCGCRKKEHDQALAGYQKRVDGTSINMLQSTKIPRNNTTGVKGVYFYRGRYIAKIVIQGRQYHLGAYETLEEAAAVRRKAEEAVGSQLAAAWALWRERADQDPEWAQRNPLVVRVEHSQQARITLHITPVMT